MVHSRAYAPWFFCMPNNLHVFCCHIFSNHFSITQYIYFQHDCLFHIYRTIIMIIIILLLWFCYSIVCIAPLAVQRTYTLASGDDETKWENTHSLTRFFFSLLSNYLLSCRAVQPHIYCKYHTPWLHCIWRRGEEKMLFLPCALRTTLRATNQVKKNHHHESRILKWTNVCGERKWKEKNKIKWQKNLSEFIIILM